MEEKEREEVGDYDDDVADITAVKLFGMHEEVFLGKEMENKKKKDEEEDKRKGNGEDGNKKIGSGAKRGKKMRGGIYRYASKGDNEDDADSWDEHYFDVII